MTVINIRQVTQNRKCIDDKFDTVSRDMQQVRRNADKILKLNAMLGDFHNKLAAGNYNTPQSVDTGTVILRVTTTD